MSLANPEFISGNVLSRRWMLDAFELHQILQGEGLGGFDRHSNPRSPADAISSPAHHSQKTKYDVIIVGAGPSGLECARVLQDSNLSVLILEKNEQIGPKACAGGIVETVEPLELPETKARTVNAVNVFVGETEYAFVSHLSIKIIGRENLGQYQAERLSKAGNVTIKTGTTVKKIDPGRVATNAGNFGYRYLVGADGSTSIVRRYLKIDSRYMVGMYYDIEERKDRMVFYLNGTALKTGYLWEFPHQQFTNVGFYYNPMQSTTRNAVQILRNHMKRKGYPIDSRTFRAFPINYLYKGCQFGETLFLAGDAAGLASKLTGEGIAYAMISGREIARKIMDPHYELPKLKEIVAHKKRQDRLVNVLEKIPMGLNTIYHLHIKALKTRILRWPG
jgi:flavin-dependent dehydrogenase